LSRKPKQRTTERLARLGKSSQSHPTNNPFVDHELISIGSLFCSLMSLIRMIGLQPSYGEKMTSIIFEEQMENIISDSFYKMVNSYDKTLEKFYPARGSTGFTEANQVHIYINSLTSSLADENLVSWLEFPWEQKKQHIDGFIYSPKHKTVFYIEAKRISHTKKKKEIIGDIKRLCSADKKFIAENKVTDYKNQYIIVLSDVWLENKWKKSIPEWWCGYDNIPKQILQWESVTSNSLIRADSTIHSDLENLDWHGDCVNWHQSRTYAHWLGEKDSSPKNYCLLMAALKI
jgi:hypothetical protein